MVSFLSQFVTVNGKYAYPVYLREVHVQFNTSTAVCHMVWTVFAGDDR
jgi:hypothetical protein